LAISENIMGVTGKYVDNGMFGKTHPDAYYGIEINNESLQL